MRPEEDLVDILNRLRRWCLEAEAMVAGQPDELFRESRVHELALTKVIEQIGEVSGRLLKRHPDFVAANPELELAPAYRMRHILVHDYDDVLIEVIVDTARTDIPHLLSSIEPILRDMGEDVP